MRNRENASSREKKEERERMKGERDRTRKSERKREREEERRGERLSFLCVGRFTVTFGSRCENCVYFDSLF